MHSKIFKFVTSRPNVAEFISMRPENDQEKALDEKHSAASFLSDSSPEKELVVAKPKSFGIRKSEILTAQYENRWLKGIFFFSIFICMYVATLEAQVIQVFMGYATSSYRQHSLLSTISVIRLVVATASLPAFARLSDIFGRLELFLIAMVFRIIGYIIQSQATNVQKYGAGMVFYSFGVAGNRIIWQIGLSDISTLKWRFLAIGVLSFQGIINVWSSGEIVLGLELKYSWKFGIGMWAFIFPLACIPYVACQIHMLLKARKTEEWKQLQADKAAYFGMEENGSRKGYFVLRVKDALYNIFWNVDIVGCLCIALMFGLILVPLTLAGGISKKWSKASTIVPLVLGFVMIFVFIIWEYKLARTPLLPFAVLSNRGIWSGFAIGVFNTFITGMPNSYAYPVLLVGMNATVTVATRTPNLELFVEGVSMPIFGYILSRVKRGKPFVFLGNVVIFIAMGLFVHFRGGNDGVHAKYFRDGVAIGMCLMGFSGIFFNRLISVSIQSCTNHEYMATVTALFASFYHLGSAFGKSVSGAIWTQNMYETIEQKMREVGADPKLAKLAYQSPYKFIKVHKWGTLPRRAVSIAYAHVQRQLAITGLCLCVPLLVLTFFLRDHKLEDRHNLADDPEKAEARIGKVSFTDDNDPILNFIKRVFLRKTSKNA